MFFAREFWLSKHVDGSLETRFVTEFLRDRRIANKETCFSNAGKAMCKTLDALGLLKCGMKFFSGPVLVLSQLCILYSGFSS